MPNLVFKRLTVTSDTLKSANQFSFHPKYNLITGNDNSIGKSTLAKLLFWTLGCEPAFDTTWKSFDVRALIDFSIGNKFFQVARYGDSINIKEGNSEWMCFPKISGSYSETFAEIVGFKALLPNRKTPTKLETPPPAYYFLPFYVDQRRSWSQAWHGFLQLEQYARWQKSIVEYHTGYLLPEYFAIEEAIARNTLEKKEAESVVKRIETAIEVVNEFLPSVDMTIALTNEEFEELASEANGRLSELQVHQETILSEIAEIQSERQYLLSQLELAKVASLELEKDYSFSVENIEGEVLLCPLCGTVHDNSLASRASILADKNEADIQLTQLTEKIARLDKRLEKNKSQFEQIKNDIDSINRKFSVQEISTVGTQSTHPILDGIASRSVQKHVQKTVEAKSALIRNATKVSSLLRKDQRKIVDAEQRKEMDAYFKNCLIQYIDLLNATGVNLSNIESAMDYKKLYESGGAAESTRGSLAYLMTVIQQIYNAENEVFAPIVIDTFNQQEQTDMNYERIINFLERTLPSNSQLILCAMDREGIEAFKKKANVITLDEERLLLKNEYKNLRQSLEFDFL